MGHEISPDRPDGSGKGHPPHKSVRLPITGGTDAALPWAPAVLGGSAVPASAVRPAGVKKPDVPQEAPAARGVSLPVAGGLVVAVFAMIVAALAYASWRTPGPVETQQLLDEAAAAVARSGVVADQP